MKSALLSSLLILILANAAFGARRVSSAAGIAQLSDQLKPGDTVVLSNGTWQDQMLVLSAKGTANKPITFKAETPGKVIFSGNSSIVIDGEYLVVRGVSFQNSSGASDAILLKGTHCRLTESSVVAGRHKFFVHIAGLENRVD